MSEEAQPYLLVKLTPEQQLKAAQLLDVIIRPGDHNITEAIERAKLLLGYAHPGSPPPARRARQVKSIVQGPLRPLGEIQRAHDMLTAIVLNELPVLMDPISTKGITSALDVLCWTLQHDHNQTFAGNLARIEAAANKQGLEICDHGQ